MKPQSTKQVFEVIQSDSPQELVKALNALDNFKLIQIVQVGSKSFAFIQFNKNKGK